MHFHQAPNNYYSKATVKCTKSNTNWISFKHHWNLLEIERKNDLDYLERLSASHLFQIIQIYNLRKFNTQLIPFIINLIPLNLVSWTIFMVIVVRTDPEISHDERSDSNLQI